MALAKNIFKKKSIIFPLIETLLLEEYRKILLEKSSTFSPIEACKNELQKVLYFHRLKHTNKLTKQKTFILSSFETNKNKKVL